MRRWDRPRGIGRCKEARLFPQEAIQAGEERAHIGLQHCFTADSKKLECGCRVIYAGFPFFFCFGITGILIFQLSGFYWVSWCDRSN